MLYTLIIMTALVPTLSADGGVSLQVTHVPGFSTEQACINAGNKLPIPANARYHETKAIFTCVKMDV